METYTSIFITYILPVQLFFAGYYYGRVKKEIRNNWSNWLFVFAVAIIGLEMYLIGAGILVYKHFTTKK